MYASYLGGRQYDSGYGIALDGNVYVVGFTASGDLPVTADALQDTLAPGTCDSGGHPYPCLDGFLVKLDPSGTQILYSTYLGGPGDDWATSVALDSTGNVYLAGQAGVDFPTTQGAFQAIYSGQCDTFVAKLTFGETPLSNPLRWRSSHVSPAAAPRGVSPGAWRFHRPPRKR